MMIGKMISDCGRVGIRLTLARYFRNRDYLNYPLSELVGNDMLSVKETLEKEGLTVKGIEVAGIKFLSKNRYFLARLNIKAGHLVLVKKVTKKRVVYYDSNYEMCSLSLAEFEQLFSFETLIISSTPHHKKYKMKVRQKSETILLSSVAFFEIIPLIIGSYLLKGEDGYFYPLLFGILFLLMQIVKYMTIYYLDKRISKRTLDSHIENINDEGTLKLGLEVKNRLLLDPLQISEKFFSFCFLLIISFINNYYLGISLVVVGIFECSLRIVIKRMTQKKEKELEEIEKELYKEKGTKKRELFSRSLEKSNRISLNFFISRFFLLAINFFLAFGFTLYFMNNSLNYFIFNFFFLIFGEEISRQLYELLFKKTPLSLLNNRYQEIVTKDKIK